MLTATALSASVGELARFDSARHLASALGLPPREHSSGNRRRLGRITKRGDSYLRTLLIHGARAALLAEARPGAGQTARPNPGVGVGAGRADLSQQGGYRARQQDRPAPLGRGSTRPGF
ncbi:MAG: IS110 family transposase [Xanthomonadales bacterium]|nr:IS110 family transposase [Xanthomonadales bacterium]